MSLSSLTPYSNSLRISGLASGMDTDQIIRDFMKVQRVPYDRLYQKKQLAEWRRDDYRSVISTLSEFRSGFFDYLKPDNNMLSKTTYKQFNISAVDSVSGSTSSAVSVKGSVNAFSGTHTIRVDRLATADEAVSASAVSAALSGTPGSYNLSGKAITVTLDGVSREIALDDYTGLDDLIAKADTGLQDLLDNAFGPGKITVSNASGELNFETAGGASRLILTSGSGNSGLDELGFGSGDSNRIDTGSTLENLAHKFSAALNFDINDQLVFTINDKNFTFDKTDTLSYVINTINSDADANVNITYNEVNDKFTIKADQYGAGENIRVSQTGGSFFDSIGISTVNPVTTEGVDAQALIDGEIVTRSSNTFSVNGVQYTLLSASSNVQNITATLDVDNIYEKVTGFVEKYNEIIETLNAKLSEEYDRDYMPLTEEQKDEMGEKDIEIWEKKARTGLLRNDQLLQDIVTGMRTALYEPVDGLNISLHEIGITTDTYEKRGKLIINEIKLREAINNSPDSVMELFSRQSDIDYTDWDDREKRTREEGLAYRIYDILQDNIRITRDDNGYKGNLLVKAGKIGDSSENDNMLYDYIEDYEERMDAIYEDLISKEDAYYRKFTAMEKALSQMSMQSSWLASQFGGGLY